MRFLEEQIKQRKALLKEGEELDYDELEEELVGAVIQAMKAPSEEEAEHPAIKQEIIPEPEIEAEPEAEPEQQQPENEEEGVPVPFAALPPDQQSKPAAPRKGVESAAKRLQALRETIADSDSEYMPRKQELLESLKKLRQDMQEARHKATKEYADIYEACAKRFGVPMDESDEWKTKVNRHLKKAKLLK